MNTIKKYNILENLSKSTFRCYDEQTNQINIITKIENPIKKQDPPESSSNLLIVDPKNKGKTKDKPKTSNKNIKPVIVEENLIEKKIIEDFNFLEKSLNDTIYHNYMLKLDNFVKKDDYSYFIYSDKNYSLTNILQKNPKGLDIQFIRSILYQLLRGIKFLNRKHITFNNMKPDNVLVELHRHKSTLIGFENEIEYLSSNSYNIDHNIFTRVKLCDFSYIKSNLFVVEPVPEIQKDNKQKVDKKKPASKPIVKDKKDKNLTNTHPLIEEINNDTNYSFNRYSPPEIYLKYLFRNYTLEENENLPPNGNEVDIWGIGCILAEMIDGNQLFPLVKNDLECLNVIYKLVGLDDSQMKLFSENNIPLEVENLSTVYLNNLNQSKVDLNITIDNRYLGKTPRKCFDLLKKMLNPNPKERITIKEALKHPFLYPYFEINSIPGEYISSTPLPEEPKSMINSKIKKLSEVEKNKYILENLILAKEPYFNVNVELNQTLNHKKSKSNKKPEKIK